MKARVTKELLIKLLKEADSVMGDLGLSEYAHIRLEIKQATKAKG